MPFDPSRAEPPYLPDAARYERMRYRRVGAESGALLISGRVERTEGATNLVATRLRRLRVAAAPPSRDFR